MEHALFDVIHPQPVDNRTAEDIIQDTMKCAGLAWRK